MCSQKYDAWMLVGKDISVTAGVGEVETPKFIVEVNDGDAIGISVAENYARVDMAKCLLSLEVGSRRVFKNLPITQLIPDGERQMWPIEIPAGSEIKAKIKSISANTVVATPITLIFHHRNPKNCG